MRFNQLSVSLFTILFLFIILPAELTPNQQIRKDLFLLQGLESETFPKRKQLFGLV